METITNRFGEKQTDWASHKHPDNENFMQVVKFMHITTTDGRNNLYWRLDNASANDKHLIANISLADALSKYVDTEPVEINDAEFEKWLSQRK